MNLTFSTDDPDREPRHPGGVDMTISLTRHEARALGIDAGTLTDWLTTGLAALVALRTGHVGGDPEAPAPTVGGLWSTVINDLDNRLSFRMEGIRDAVIREHFAPGAAGSLSRLAIAMDAPRSTAQSLRNKITGREPNTWERWATGTLPTGTEVPTWDLDKPGSPDAIDPDLAATLPPEALDEIEGR